MRPPGAILLLFVTVTVGPFILVRAYSRALERRPIGTERKIRRLVLAYGASLVLLIVPISAFLTLAASFFPERSISRNFALALLLGVTIGGAAWILGMAMTSLAIVPSYLRIHPGGGGRFGVSRTVAWVSAGLLVVLPALIVLYLLRIPLTQEPMLWIVPLLVGFLGWIIAAPLIRVYHPGSRSAEPVLADRVSQLCERVGMPVKGVYVFELPRKNEVKVSIWSSVLGNYISMSDYVVSQFDPAEIEALVARAIAYKRGHVWFILVAPPVLVGLAAAVAMYLAGFAVPVAVTALVIVVLLGGWAWNKVLRPWALNTDRRVDDFAATTVGLEPTIASLEKAALAIEPGPRPSLARKAQLAERIDRLRQGASS